MLGEFKPLDKATEITRHRRDLPHWQQAACTYFVTFRLADALPQSKLNQWSKEYSAWLAHHPKPWDDSAWREYHVRFGDTFQKWLHAGYGECPMKDPECRVIVVDALLHFDRQRYALDAFVIMPNHVHALVQLAPSHGLVELMHSWKSFTANKINKLLNRKGTLWFDEYFDHVVRSWSQFEWYRTYIRDNPSQARLATGTFSVGCGSGIRLPASS